MTHCVFADDHPIENAETHPKPFSASLQKNTIFLAVLLAGTTISTVLGMQAGSGYCEHCDTHQYGNTVTYNKHGTGPTGTYYTEQRVVTSTSDAGRPVSISSVAHESTSNNNHVTYEGTGNQTNFAQNLSTLFSACLPTVPFSTFGTIIKILFTNNNLRTFIITREVLSELLHLPCLFVTIQPPSTE